MPIVQQGSINTTALYVPDIFVQVVPPQNTILNGVPTNVLGVVGTAAWGPVGQPTIVGSYADYVRAFGALQARKYDMGTIVATAVQQGANNFRCVRVTDGTDAASTGAVSTCVTFTARYTGTVGNGLAVTISTGSAASSWRAVVSLPGVQPEMFDNITGSGNAFWVNLAAAINAGQSGLRGPSQLVTAAAGAGTTAASAQTIAFSSGTDGVGTITASVLVGVDTATRLGMYALRGQGCSVAVLADSDTSSSWTTQLSFGLSEAIYMVLTGPAADTISNAASTKRTAGIDSYGAKVMHGDWVYWSDQTTNTVRLVSPQGFIAGRLVNLSPEQSSLNKPIYGVIGTQKSGVPGSAQVQTYSYAELQSLFQAGIDVITNPVPGGYYWGARGGYNASSNAGTNDDSYTRLTNYIATSLQAGMGIFVGRLINADTMRQVRATLLSFLASMLQQGLLGSTRSGTLPFAVVCDLSNNPLSRTALGYLQADCQIQYQGIVKAFIVNLEGGQTVTVASRDIAA